MNQTIHFEANNFCKIANVCTDSNTIAHYLSDMIFFDIFHVVFFQRFYFGPKLLARIEKLHAYAKSIFVNVVYTHDTHFPVFSFGTKYEKSKRFLSFKTKPLNNLVKLVRKSLIHSILSKMIAS